MLIKARLEDHQSGLIKSDTASFLQPLLVERVCLPALSALTAGLQNLFLQT